MKGNNSEMSKTYKYTLLKKWCFTAAPQFSSLQRGSLPSSVEYLGWQLKEIAGVFSLITVCHGVTLIAITTRSWCRFIYLTIFIVNRDLSFCLNVLIYWHNVETSLWLLWSKPFAVVDFCEDDLVEWWALNLSSWSVLVLRSTVLCLDIHVLGHFQNRAKINLV